MDGDAGTNLINPISGEEKAFDSTTPPPPANKKNGRVGMGGEGGTAMGKLSQSPAPVPEQPFGMGGMGGGGKKDLLVEVGSDFIVADAGTANTNMGGGMGGMGRGDNAMAKQSSPPHSSTPLIGMGGAPGPTHKSKLNTPNVAGANGGKGGKGGKGPKGNRSPVGLVAGAFAHGTNVGAAYASDRVMGLRDDTAAGIAVGVVVGVVAFVALYIFTTRTYIRCSCVSMRVHWWMIHLRMLA
jgi:hypothetical protein